MSQINVQNLTFAYDGGHENLFENVSLRLDTDWKLGLTGRNGRGKTTFLKLLQGEFEYGGSITSPVGFEYFPFPVPDETLTAAEVAERACPGCRYWQLARETGLLELPEEALSRRFDTLSQGERTKLLLAALFLRPESFLLIDEPTNHLDMRGRELVSRYLNGKKGFILVSHDRVFLDSCIDHILAINRGGIEVQQGNFSTWYYNNELRDRYEMAENEKLRGEISRLKASAREKSAWADKTESAKRGTTNSGLKPDRGYLGHKAAKMMKRSKAIEKRREDAVEERSSLLKNLETAEPLKLAQPVFYSERLLELREVRISYGEKPVCGPVGFEVRRGDRIALRGCNGSGKSSILKLLCGEPVPHTGLVDKSGRLVISYVPQASGELRGSLSDFAEKRGIDESLYKAILRKLGFSRAQFAIDMADMSAGQRRKALIAASLCERAHLLVWDEPLNYIDVVSRMQIESLLRDSRPTVIFVEHDRAFCDNIATKTVLL